MYVHAHSMCHGVTDHDSTLWEWPEWSTPEDSSVKLYYGIYYNLPPGDSSEN